jgi:hypothetical protein
MSAVLSAAKAFKSTGRDRFPASAQRVSKFNRLSLLNMELSTDPTARCRHILDQSSWFQWRRSPGTLSPWGPTPDGAIAPTQIPSQTCTRTENERLWYAPVNLLEVHLCV